MAAGVRDAAQCDVRNPPAGQDPRERSRCTRGGRNNTPGRDARRHAGHGSGLWPHSPAIPLGPVKTSPRTTMPAPVPVPTMTPKHDFGARRPRHRPPRRRQSSSRRWRFGPRVPSRRSRSASKRLADEPDRVGVLDEAGGGGDRSRDADADRRARAGPLLERVDQRPPPLRRSPDSYRAEYRPVCARLRRCRASRCPRSSSHQGRSRFAYGSPRRHDGHD